jgi:regulator of RNase E activity RraA
LALSDTVVEPGDWIVADGGGAVAVSEQDVDEISARAEELTRGPRRRSRADRIWTCNRPAPSRSLLVALRRRSLF